MAQEAFLVETVCQLEVIQTRGAREVVPEGTRAGSQSQASIKVLDWQAEMGRMEALVEVEVLEVEVDRDFIPSREEKEDKAEHTDQMEQ